MVAESHTNLAPASLHIAEIDTLMSEGIAYHEKLKAAGTPSEMTIYKGVAHPFGHWDGELPAAKDFIKNCIDALRKAYKL
jgi:acetyl esterase/lipase